MAHQTLEIERGLPLQQLIRLRIVAALIEYDQDPHHTAVSSAILVPFRRNEGGPLPISMSKTNLSDDSANEEEHDATLSKFAKAQKRQQQQLQQEDVNGDHDDGDNIDADSDAGISIASSSVKSDSVSSQEALSEWGLESYASKLHHTPKHKKKKAATVTNINNKNVKKHSKSRSVATTSKIPLSASPSPKQQHQQHRPRALSFALPLTIPQHNSDSQRHQLLSSPLSLSNNNNDDNEDPIDRLVKSEDESTTQQRPTTITSKRSSTKHNRTASTATATSILDRPRSSYIVNNQDENEFKHEVRGDRYRRPSSVAFGPTLLNSTDFDTSSSSPRPRENRPNPHLRNRRAISHSLEATTTTSSSNASGNLYTFTPSVSPTSPNQKLSFLDQEPPPMRNSFISSTKRRSSASAKVLDHHSPSSRHNSVNFPTSPSASSSQLSPNPSVTELLDNKEKHVFPSKEDGKDQQQPLPPVRSKRDSTLTMMTMRSTATSILDRPRPKLMVEDEDENNILDQDDANQDQEDEEEGQQQDMDKTLTQDLDETRSNLSKLEVKSDDQERPSSPVSMARTLSFDGLNGTGTKSLAASLGTRQHLEGSAIADDDDDDDDDNGNGNDGYASYDNISRRSDLGSRPITPGTRASTPLYNTPLRLAVPLDEDHRMAHWSPEEREAWAQSEQENPLPRFPNASRPLALVMPAPLLFEKIEKDQEKAEQEEREKEEKRKKEEEEREMQLAQKPARDPGTLYGTSLMETLAARKEIQKNRKRAYMGDSRRAMHQVEGLTPQDQTQQQQPQPDQQEDVNSTENLIDDREPFKRYSTAFNLAMKANPSSSGGPGSIHSSSGHGHTSSHLAPPRPGSLNGNNDGSGGRLPVHSVFGYDKVMEREMIKLQKILEIEEQERMEEEEKNRQLELERQRKEDKQAEKEAKRQAKRNKKHRKEMEKRRMSVMSTATAATHIIEKDGSRKLRRKSNMLQSMDLSNMHQQFDQYDHHTDDEDEDVDNEVWPPPLSAFGVIRKSAHDQDQDHGKTLSVHSPHRPNFGDDEDDQDTDMPRRLRVNNGSVPRLDVEFDHEDRLARRLGKLDEQHNEDDESVVRPRIKTGNFGRPRTTWFGSDDFDKDENGVVGGLESESSLDSDDSDSGSDHTIGSNDPKPLKVAQAELREKQRKEELERAERARLEKLKAEMFANESSEDEEPIANVLQRKANNSSLPAPTLSSNQPIPRNRHNNNNNNNNNTNVELSHVLDMNVEPSSSPLMASFELNNATTNNSNADETSSEDAPIPMSRASVDFGNAIKDKTNVPKIIETKDDEDNKNEEPEKDANKDDEDKDKSKNNSRNNSNDNDPDPDPDEDEDSEDDVPIAKRFPGAANRSHSHENGTISSHSHGKDYLAVAVNDGKNKTQDEDDEDVPIGKRITCVRDEDDVPLALKNPEEDTPLAFKAAQHMDEDDKPLGLADQASAQMAMALRQQQEHMLMLSIQQDAALLAQGPDFMMMPPGGMDPSQMMNMNMSMPMSMPAMSMPMAPMSMPPAMPPAMPGMMMMPQPDMSMSMPMSMQQQQASSMMGPQQHEFEQQQVPHPTSGPAQSVPALPDPSVVAGAPGGLAPPPPVTNDKLISSIDRWRQGVAAEERVSS